MHFLLCFILGCGGFHPGDDILDDLFLDAVEAVKVRRVARISGVVSAAVPGDLHRSRIGQFRLQLGDPFWGRHIAVIVAVMGDEDRAGNPVQIEIQQIVTLFIPRQHGCGQYDTVRARANEPDGRVSDRVCASAGTDEPHRQVKPFAQVSDYGADIGGVIRRAAKPMTQIVFVIRLRIDDHRDDTAVEKMGPTADQKIAVAPADFPALRQFHRALATGEKDGDGNGIGNGFDQQAGSFAT